MGKTLLKDVSISVNAVEYGNNFSEIAINTERDEVEVTGFQATHKEYLPGMADATIEGTAFVDFGASSLDAAFWPLSQQDTPFPIVIKPHAVAVSAANPSYTAQVLMYEYSPIAGAVGEAATTPVTFRNADPDGIVRAIV